ncbi:hypothetical protein ACN8ZM_39735 (plasmid) [Burkholderia aenigmatica]|uniref:hypothetical protein n=1 Tax=Burkholderia aenigmatica TaxID=2015348 RepID=UPI003B436801
MATDRTQLPATQSLSSAVVTSATGTSLVIGAAVALIHRDHESSSAVSLLAFALIGCAGIFLVRRSALSLAAHRFRRRSARAISRSLDKSWILECPDGQPVPIAVLTSPTGERWVVSIHRLQHAKVRRAFGGLGGQRLFLGRQEADLSGLAHAAGAAFDGHPIAWLPGVPGKAGVFESANGLPIATGNVRALLESIGARKAWSLF